jgi:hypothetical protein
MYMKFHKPFSILEKIQLLQRSILVNSFAYYELDENILSDFQYDDNAKQLAELRRQYPDEFDKSAYNAYFYDYSAEDDKTHYTSGFDLLSRVKTSDKDLYRRLRIDAIMALENKKMRGCENI